MENILKNKNFFYILLFLTLIIEIILIVLFVNKDVSVLSFVLIGLSNLGIMISSFLNIKKIIKNK
ncbi:hypothetical protein D1J35_10740 [Riemerella anatipestifer]|nr:hypothetical protein [Riemerella anatipestifer]